MASKSRKTFVKNCEDIDRLIDIHADLTGDAPGRRWKVEALHKSAMVLLTAFWEAFCEDLAAEALQHIVANASDAGSLPQQLQNWSPRNLRQQINTSWPYGN